MNEIEEKMSSIRLESESDEEAQLIMKMESLRIRKAIRKKEVKNDKVHLPKSMPPPQHGGDQGMDFSKITKVTVVGDFINIMIKQSIDTVLS